ncbi:MAG: DUF4912 domain-containing protein [Verrucomicrobiae bacterium]|nr:DUF4912 domain-containing protein [Verrucomicrobiae bacterium]
MSLKDLLSKPKAELVTLAKKLKLRGVFQLPKDALAKRIVTAAETEKPVRSGTAKKRTRGVRSVSQRRSRLAALMEKIKPTPSGISATRKKRVATAPAKPARAVKPAEPMTAPKRATKPEPVEQAKPDLVVSHRYEVPGAAKQTFIEENLGELPDSYATGRLFLSARDPHWMYSYWDYGREQMHDFRMSARNGTVYLRVCDVTDINFNGHNAPVAQEIALDPNAREWYIHVAKASRNWVAQLGFYEPNGNFRVVSTSRVTHTPSDSVSNDTRARFVTIPFEIPFEHLKEMIRQYLREGGQLADVLAQLQEEDFPFPFPVPRHGRWTTEQQESLINYMGEDLLRRIRVGSFEISEWLRKRLLSEMGSAAISSLFSPFGASWSGKKGFWLNVNAELIIYGATESDAKVTIDGKEVKLRPDGSFSFHTAFPDGKYALPIKAVAADKHDSRAISLNFERRTKDKKGEVGEVPVFAPIPSPSEVTLAK